MDIVLVFTVLCFVLFVFDLCLVCQMLPVSLDSILDCPFGFHKRLCSILCKINNVNNYSL